MKTIKGFLTKHSITAYFALAFAISWGCLLTVIGLGGFTGAAEPTDAQLPFVYLAMFAGPSVAGLLSTGLVRGPGGFLELRSRLLRWRVDARWYAVAILTAPLLMMSTLFALSFTSPVFLPGIFATDDEKSLLLMGFGAGLATGFFEELGWTGFAIPRMTPRRGILTTGLSVGALWGAWHFPLFSGGDSSGAVPPALFLPAQLFTALPAYRVLMVWVYDRTGSLLIAMIMHASLTASTLIFYPLAIAGMPAVTHNLVSSGVLWTLVALVAMANRGGLSAQPVHRMATDPRNTRAVTAAGGGDSR